MPQRKPPGSNLLPWRGLGWFRNLVWALGMALLAALTRADTPPGTLFFVIGSDTAIWNWPGGIDVLEPTNHFTSELYTDPVGRAYQAMDPGFRQSMIDSFGNPMRLTWWMMVGNVYGTSDNQNVPVPNLMPLHLMRQYHGDSIRDLGDELTLHYHTFLWSDYNGDGKFYWNQARTFHECRADFDRSIAQALIEEETFTVTFRSGWHYMDNEWQQYCNQLWPYNMDNDSPTKSFSRVEPLFNQIDWSLAPLDFVPFQPSATNYQIPGGTGGWNVRSVKMPNVDQALVDRIFEAAALGTNEVVSLWAHLPETDFLDQVRRMDQLIQTSSGSHPGALFRYCTSIEAMQRWRGTDDTVPPVLSVSESEEAGVPVLQIHTDEAIFQREPFVALRDASGNYRILSCEAGAANTWRARIPLQRSSVSKVGIAVTDPSGNLTTRVLRLGTEDQYVDNLNPGYHELSGVWTSTALAAWGTNARISHLIAGEAAVAEWTLPVTNVGRFSIAMQLPPVTNRVPALRWELLTNGVVIDSSELGPEQPASQWIPLASVPLDPGATNVLRLTAAGGSDASAGTVAVADVVRISPAPKDAVRISDVRVQAGATAATVLWRTDRPCADWVEYGADIRYGKVCVTNLLGVTNHVATLHQLIPGTNYQFQIVCRSGTMDTTRQGELTTSEDVAPPQVSVGTLVTLDQPWKFTTTNLDGTAWTTAAFDDSAWNVGHGILWVDTRPSGANPSIEPLGTRMPFNEKTGFPYTTYSLRTRFTNAVDARVTHLIFTNYIDDGAVLSLDGRELYRNNLPPAPSVVTNSEFAMAYNCTGDATCPVVFDIPILLTGGEHQLAVEVHNYNKDSPDITFGASVTAMADPVPTTVLGFWSSGDYGVLHWTDNNWILQRAASFSVGGPEWEDVGDGIGASPYWFHIDQSALYRLRH